jgi:hypothetical protein
MLANIAILAILWRKSIAAVQFAINYKLRIMRSMQTLTPHQNLASVAIKASARTALVSSSAGWMIQTHNKGERLLLMAERSKAPRVFRKMETATEYLRKIGVTTFIVEIGEAVEKLTPESRRRPDRSAAMQQTFQSASDWETWYANEVDIAVKEADSSSAQWVANADAKKQWAIRRADLLASTKTSTRV